MVSDNSDEDSSGEDPANIMIDYLSLSTYITEDENVILMDRDSEEDNNTVWEYVVGARGEILAYDRMIVAYGEVAVRNRDGDKGERRESDSDRGNVRE